MVTARSGILPSPVVSYWVSWVVFPNAALIRREGSFWCKSTQRRLEGVLDDFAAKMVPKPRKPPLSRGVDGVLRISRHGHPSYFCDHFGGSPEIPENPRKMAFAYTYFPGTLQTRLPKTASKKPLKYLEKRPLRTPIFWGTSKNTPKPT